MVEFAYNIATNMSTRHKFFELNCGYHLQISYKEEVNSCFQSKSADELSAKLTELMVVCYKNLHHTQEFQKRAHNKSVKPMSYSSVEKVWLNSKYMRTKQNQKLEVKLFKPFQVLHLVGKQVYKLELPKK